MWEISLPSNSAPQITLLAWTSLGTRRKPRIGWPSYQRRFCPHQIWHTRSKQKHRCRNFYAKINRRVHCLAKGRSSTSWVDNWNSFWGNSWPCYWFKDCLCSLGCIKKWICIKFTLKQQVTYLRKEDDKNVSEHSRTFKGLCDSLASIEKHVSDKEKVFYLLTGLGLQNETFTTTMLKPPRLTYFELVS